MAARWVGNHPAGLRGRQYGRFCRSDTVSVSGACLHRAWRALLGCGVPGGSVWADAQLKEFAKAALQSVGYQTRDLLMAMLDDMGAVGPAVLRVDGGMTASDWTMQFLADILGAPVDRPQVLETTALGAAWLAGSRAGVYPDKAGFAKTWALEQRFEPQMPVDTRDTLYAGWKDAVRRTLG